MRRALLSLVPLLGLLLVAVAAAQDKDKPAEKKAGEARKEANAPPRFNVDQFLKDYDRNGDGFLQREEVPPYLRDRFDDLDTNKDGKLSRDELEKAGGSLEPRRRPSDFVYLLIELSDCDDDCHGEVQQIYDALRKLDRNKDGKIDAEELKAGRQQLLEARVDAILTELDTNKDGRVSREEARGRVKRDFDQLDANKDGFIDRDELLRAATERINTKKER